MFKAGYNPTKVFWILIIGCIISIFAAIFNNFYSADIKYFGNTLENITVNVEFSKEIDHNDFLICFNDICKSSLSNTHNNIYFVKFNPEAYKDEFFESPVKKITLIHKNKKEIGNIEYILLYVGSKVYRYNSNEIAKFQNKVLNIKFDSTGNVEKVNSIILPNDFKTNYKGILNHLCILFLFIFYGWKHFIVSYIMLIGAIYLYIKNNIKLNCKITALLPLIIIASTVILRFNLLNYYPLWLDELYTKTIATKTFLSCFQDAGNPPLFYILEFIISKLFGKYDIVLLAIPYLAGCLSVYFVYMLFKNISKNLALFAAFMASINTILIYHSQEIRSSSLCALLIISSIYLLFEYIKNKSAKNLIFYSTAAILAINTHYYLTIFIFVNYLYGLFRIDKKNKIIFTFANIICSLTFLPYLNISFKRACDATFNGWIGNFNHLKFVYAIKEFFLNKYIFIFIALVILISLFICIFKKNTINKEAKNLFYYVLYSVTAIIIIVSIISITIKPIFHKRLCLSIYPLLLISEIMLIYFSTHIKQLFFKIMFSFVLFITFISITHPMPLKYMCRLDEFADFINYDYRKYKNEGYEVHGIVTDYTGYLDNFPQISDKSIIWHTVDGNAGGYISDFRKTDYTNSKRAVIYLNTISIDFGQTISPIENAYIYRTNVNDNAKIIYND